MGSLNLSVVGQHTHAASALWLRRDLAVRSPHYRLAELQKLDGQLDANLDGLRIAGELGWQTCIDELHWAEPGEVFVAASLALEADDDARIGLVLKTVGNVYELQRAFVAACGWIPEAQLRRIINDFWDSDDPQRRYLALASWAVHRSDRPQGLNQAIKDGCPQLRARAIRAVGELARGDLLDELGNAMRNELDARCRIAAAWTLARLMDDQEAVSLLQSFVVGDPSGSQLALTLAARRLPPDRAIDWVRSLAAEPGSHRNAIIAAGALALVDLVPLLLDNMSIPELARIAGEAFSMITGVDLAYQDLEGEWPEGFEAGPNDDPEDENVEMDPDENLPWPHVEKLKNWWAQHQDEFEPGQRYLCGQPMTESWLQHVLRHGYQRQRAAAALELAIRNPGQPLFNVRAPGHRQQRLLGLK